MMTVNDENEDMDKYEYLVFVEFLEMLCRLALELIVIKEPDNNSVEFKVLKLLQLMQD